MTDVLTVYGTPSTKLLGDGDLPLPIEVLWQSLCTHRACWQARPLYVACSGGRDSLALAFACLALYKDGKLPALPTLIHINHQLQDAAEAWAEGVRDFARLHGFACQVVKVSPANHDENSARTARYQGFWQVMADDGVLLFAHHEDDQAETVLMRLVAGSGLKGLSGMQVWQDRQVKDEAGCTKLVSLFRPWLGISREAISDYAKAHSLPYVDDPTNLVGDNTRSHLRQAIIPHLRALNPKATQNIARTAQVLNTQRRLIDAHLDDVCKQVYESSLCFGRYQMVLSILRLTQEQKETSQALIVRFMQADLPYGADFALVQAVLALCWRTDSDHKTELFWRGGQDNEGVVFCRYQTRLYRYLASLWQAFWEKSVAKVGQGCALTVGRYTQALPSVGLLTPVSRTDKIPYRHKTLSGKKLYQTLGVPVWLRAHLYLATFEEGADGVRTCLVSFGHTWCLGQGVCTLGALYAT